MLRPVTLNTGTTSSTPAPTTHAPLAGGTPPWTSCASWTLGGRSGRVWHAVPHPPPSSWTGPNASLPSLASRLKGPPSAIWASGRSAFSRSSVCVRGSWHRRRSSTRCSQRAAPSASANPTLPSPPPPPEAWWALSQASTGALGRICPCRWSTWRGGWTILC